jgi:glyoxylase I family protein
MDIPRRQVLQFVSFAFGSTFALDRLAAQIATPPTTPPSPAGGSVTHGSAGETKVERVMGIGGFFFRAHDPTGLGHWYQQHLGISLTPRSYQDTVWQQEAGPTVFSPFPEKSDYFGDAHKDWMLNFRVRDLDKMATQLRAAGIAVEIDPQSYPNGRFASLHDPEGNPIQLWQPG